MDPSLPSELLVHICTFLASNTADLAAVARVHSSWSAAAQRVLYSRLATHRPLHTIATCPRLATLVRSFALHHDPPSIALLPAALANMSLLLELDLFLDSSLLHLDASFPLLQRFATSLPWSPLLVRFLHNCPTITQLYLDSPAPFDHLPLPPAFLPSLSHFTGPPALALLLIPHRPVQHIDLTPTPQSLGLTPDLALSLSQSSAPVLALAATTSESARDQPEGEDENLVGVLKILAVCMAHLRHLRVVTNTYADTSTFANVSHQAYFENIAHSLTSLPDLQSCEIWGFHWVSSIKKDMSYSALTTTTTTWHSPSISTPNYLDDLYQDLIFPY